MVGDGSGTETQHRGAVCPELRFAKDGAVLTESRICIAEEHNARRNRPPA